MSVIYQRQPPGESESMPTAINPEWIRAHLKRVLSSRIFLNSPRLQEFLQYVVNETLEGRADHIKGFTVGLMVFQRADAEDAQSSTIVRVEAARLRRHLDDYYAGEGRKEVIHINIPKGGYVPCFETVAVPERERRRTLAKAPSRPVIVVQPFEDMTSTKTADSLAAGLTEDIITSLSTRTFADVIAHSSLVAFKGKAVNPEQVGHDLMASHVVQGSIRGEPTKHRFTVQLVDTQKGLVVWAERYDRDPGDELVLQDQLARKIVEGLSSNFVEQRPLRELAAK